MVFVHGGWNTNALRFATREEAEAYARDLYSRWTLCEGHCAQESEDEVNYAWVDGRAVRLEVVDA